MQLLLFNILYILLFRILFSRLNYLLTLLLLRNSFVLNTVLGVDLSHIIDGHPLEFPIRAVRVKVHYGIVWLACRRVDRRVSPNVFGTVISFDRHSRIHDIYINEL